MNPEEPDDLQARRANAEQRRRERDQLRGSRADRLTPIPPLGGAARPPRPPAGTPSPPPDSGAPALPDPAETVVLDPVRAMELSARASRRPEPEPLPVETPPTAPLAPGGRAERRRELRNVQRLRLATLAVATVVLLGALPAFFLIRDVTRDPVFRALDSLDVPAWADAQPLDRSLGSRWCWHTCRIRERVARSSRQPEETATAYHRALRAENWRRWSVDGCPARDLSGSYTCWRRDEYVLDIWIRSPHCDGGAQCPPAVITIVVRNSAADPRR